MLLSFHRIFWSINSIICRAIAFLLSPKVTACLCSAILAFKFLPVSSMYVAPQSHGIKYTTPSLSSLSGCSLAWTSRFLSVGRDVNAVLILDLEQILIILSVFPLVYPQIQCSVVSSLYVPLFF